MSALLSFEQALADARLAAPAPAPAGVRSTLTPQRRRRKRARRPVEATDYAAMMRRLIRAYGRRVADADVEDLADMLAVRAELDEAIASAVRVSRERWGRSWADIGRAAGVTKQTAHERWGSA